jgi:hypothetical protein
VREIEIIPGTEPYNVQLNSTTALVEDFGRLNSSVTRFELPVDLRVRVYRVNHGDYKWIEIPYIAGVSKTVVDLRSYEPYWSGVGLFKDSFDEDDIDLFRGDYPLPEVDPFEETLLFQTTDVGNGPAIRLVNYFPVMPANGFTASITLKFSDPSVAFHALDITFAQSGSYYDQTQFCVDSLNATQMWVHVNDNPANFATLEKDTFYKFTTKVYPDPVTGFLMIAMIIQEEDDTIISTIVKNGAIVNVNIPYSSVTPGSVWFPIYGTAQTLTVKEISILLIP